MCVCVCVGGAYGGKRWAWSWRLPWHHAALRFTLRLGVDVHGGIALLNDPALQCMLVGT